MRPNPKLMCAMYAVAFIACAAGAAASLANSAHRHKNQVCFPASEWGPAPDSERPCVHVELYEDGTFRSDVTQADGDDFPRP